MTMRVQMSFSAWAAESAQLQDESDMTEKYYYNVRDPKRLALANPKG